MNEPFVHKVMVGKVQQITKERLPSSKREPWETGMLKESVEEHVWLSMTGLAGDEVADKKNHGGKEKAVFAYPIQHYTYWRNALGIEEIDVGSMGENLSVLEMDEHTVCIGDTYAFGDAIIEVSQPREPCWKPGELVGIHDLAIHIKQTGRSGWYFRVIQEGYVLSRIDIELLERPYPEWSIAACQEVAANPLGNLRRTRDLLSCEKLAERWKRPLRKILFG